MKSNWPIFENWVWTWLFISLSILKVPTTSKPAGHNTYICRENYLQHPQEIYRTTTNISVRLTNLYDNPEPSDTQNVLRINVVRIFHSHIGTHGIGTWIHFIIQKHQPEQEFVQEPGCGIRFVVSMSFDGLFCWVGTYYLLFAIYCRWGEGNWALPCYYLCMSLFLLWITPPRDLHYNVSCVVLHKSPTTGPLCGKWIGFLLIYFSNSSWSTESKIKFIESHCWAFVDLQWRALTNAEPSSLTDETRPNWTLLSHAQSISQSYGI